MALALAPLFARRSTPPLDAARAEAEAEAEASATACAADSRDKCWAVVRYEASFKSLNFTAYACTCSNTHSE